MNNPTWQKTLETDFYGSICNTFMLTGNIGDYAKDTIMLRDYLIDWAKNTMKFKDVIFYDINTGGCSVQSKQENIGFSDTINKMLEAQGNRLFVFYYPEYIIPAGDFSQMEDKRRIVALHKTINSSQFLAGNNMALFVTDSARNIHPMFLGSNSRIKLVNIELPNLDRRKDFITYWFQEYSHIKAAIRFENVTINTIANMTAGLQLINIEDIFLRAKKEGRINTRMILNEKKDIIQKEFGEVIEIFDTEGLSLSKFAGQEEMKKYFKEVVIDAIRNNNLGIVPKGVLLMGPPGTGKTFFAKCLAADSGISFVEFKISKILGKYVGDSEKAMEKALSVFRALAPVGIFMDEIDQAMARGSGGSDGGSKVNANLFGMLLAEMSKPSNRGKVLWIAATNYPNNVDEALKRAGRFDKKIPFFAPNAEERKNVFLIHLNGKVREQVYLSDLVDATEGYTQAEIEAIVVKALELARRSGQDKIGQRDLNRALEYMLSNQNDKIREMEDIALKECNDQEFIPKAYKERHRELMSRNSVNSSIRMNRGGS